MHVVLATERGSSRDELKKDRPHTPQVRLHIHMERKHGTLNKTVLYSIAQYCTVFYSIVLLYNGMDSLRGGPLSVHIQHTRCMHSYLCVILLALQDRRCQKIDSALQYYSLQ